MKFALNYYYNPSQTGPAASEVADWIAFDQEAREAGVFVFETGYHDASESQTVTVRDGNVEVTNTGTANAENVMAGFYVIDVTTLQDALLWAQRIPTTTYGLVEVRRVVEFEG